MDSGKDLLILVFLSVLIVAMSAIIVKTTIDHDISRYESHKPFELQ